MKVDLHIHSIYSDSSRSPEEIVALAKKRNVGLLSICDHATIGAYSVLPEICRDNGMNYVLGVELEVLWKGESLHMLGATSRGAITTSPLNTTAGHPSQRQDMRHGHRES